MATPAYVEPLVRRAAAGPRLDGWNPPGWLLAHQVEGARRVAASLDIFGGALLADAAGLGKTYVALAVATRYARAAAAVPASLIPQWRRTANGLEIDLPMISHEALSRGHRVPPTDFLIVDEAHHFRNPQTRRYDRIARDLRGAQVLLMSATPVVNRAADLAHLLRLFLPDHGLAMLGVASIEAAVQDRTHHRLRRAAGALTVARSPRSTAVRLPRTRDRRELQPPPLEHRALDGVIRAIEHLDFPDIGDPHAAAMLRLHLLHRLASSGAAAVETVGRHLHYVERALTAAKRGTQLSRSAMRAIFAGDDEYQLEFGLLDVRTGAADATALRGERRRLRALVRRLEAASGRSPKIVALHGLLARRRRRSTIVFTTAVATARELGQSLGWREVAVVGGGRARIASGTIPLKEALSLFAPRARGVSAPHRATRVATLIATDLVSEGLDLQDADGIVHYDLPWTPLRLAQRLGRIVRLGSHHQEARVWWFVPPAPLERRLRLRDRLVAKRTVQLALGVATTSAPGRARVWNAQIEAREAIAGRARGPAVVPPGYAVVQGPRAVLLALRWLRDGRPIPELACLDGDPPVEVDDYGRMRSLVNALTAAPISRAPPPPCLLAACRELVRHRLAAADRGPSSGAGRRLSRRLLDRARRAGRRRARSELQVLDAVLDRVASGLRVGTERELLELLVRQRPPGCLRRWLERVPPGGGTSGGFRLDAALFGDGTEL